MPCIINTALQLFGRLAQLVEHLLDVQRVSGSIPLASTKKDPNLSVIGDGFGFFVLVFYVSGIKQASSARRHVWDAALFPCPHPLCIKSNCDLALGTAATISKRASTQAIPPFDPPCPTPCDFCSGPWHQVLIFFLQIHLFGMPPMLENAPCLRV